MHRRKGNEGTTRHAMPNSPSTSRASNFHLFSSCPTDSVMKLIPLRSCFLLSNFPLLILRAQYLPSSAFHYLELVLLLKLDPAFILFSLLLFLSLCPMCEIGVLKPLLPLSLSNSNPTHDLTKFLGFLSPFPNNIVAFSIQLILVLLNCYSH